LFDEVGVFADQADIKHRARRLGRDRLLARVLWQEGEFQ
jgi:hypothetical protein